ncbi:MAG: tagatose 1,6-diphosphate aldolase [Burkholderiaceae bacterium]
MKLSAGKLWGMRRLADQGGRWKMIAIDQRTPLMGPIAKKRDAAEAPYADLAAVKSAVTRHLSPHASAMLMDPNFAYPRCAGEMSPAIGLCLSLEHHVTDETAHGRLSTAIPSWSVQQIRRIGADAVKLLAWYRPDAAPSVCAQQQEWVRRIGAECRAHDIVLLLELLVYPLPSDQEGWLAANRARLVQESMRDFADPGFGVDIYKLEPPAVLHGVPDPDGPQAGAVQRAYDALGTLTTRPWVLLSAGAGPADFQRSLTFAYRAGASGYLCGRAIWQQAFERFPDLPAMERELAGAAVRYVQQINALTDRLAVPWQRHAAWRGEVAMAGDGPEFAARYPAG